MFSDTDLLYKIPERSILDQVKGAFAKRVAVVVLTETGSPEYTDFLKKILLAAGLDLENDTLLAELEAGGDLSFMPLLKSKQAESVLVFGLAPKQLGLHLDCPRYQPLRFYGLRFLFADKLSVLEPDQTLKRNLWQALQQMYLNG